MRRWAWWQRVAALTGLAVVAALTAFLGVALVASIQERDAALAALATTRNESSMRIEELQRQIGGLTGRLVVNGAALARLSREVAALTAQLRAHGIVPVVVTPTHSTRSSPTSSRSPAPSPHRSPAPSPSPRVTPTPRPSPAPSCVVAIGLVCVQH